MLDMTFTGYANNELAAKCKRAETARRLMSISPNIKSDTITRISIDDLKLLFDLYDEIYFNGWFKSHYQGLIKFSLSRRLTSNAGITITPVKFAKIPPSRQVIEIRMAVDFYLQYDAIKEAKYCCGIKTSNSLEAFQLVFEHELCHVFEYIVYGRSACGRERFKSIARGIFGHKGSLHGLPTKRQIAGKVYGIKIGDAVGFTIKGKKTKGIIYNITKRATVIVKDRKGTHIDKYGNIYTKYYIPIESLESGQKNA